MANKSKSVRCIEDSKGKKKLYLLTTHKLGNLRDLE